MNIIIGSKSLIHKHIKFASTLLQYVSLISIAHFHLNTSATIQQYATIAQCASLKIAICHFNIYSYTLLLKILLLKVYSSVSILSA